MLDIKFLINNKDAVKENIKKKFQDDKIPLVDEAADLYAQIMEAKHISEDLRAQRNKLSAQVPALMKEGKKEEAEAIRAQVKENAGIMKEKEAFMDEASAKLDEIMKRIPQIIDPSVPIGKDDSENVEVERFGEPVVPDYEIPYHAEIMTSLCGLDKESAGRVAGTGFYYLMGDIARLHEAVLAYARDFMIDHGFTYMIPPFMMHKSIVEGVMSFEEMEAMMYKIEGEDLYLIGTSEHTMIGRFVGQIVEESDLPLTLTSYSPCFR